MASLALRRSLPGRGALRRLLPTYPQSAAAASSFRRSFQSEEGTGESVDEFAKRLLNQTGQDDSTRIQEDGNTLYGKLDGTRNSFRRQGTGSGMGDFDRHGGRGNPGFGDRNGFAGSMDGFDGLDDGMNEKLDDAARTFHMTDEVEDDDYDYDFRPDVNYRRGSTYSVKDLDLTRPAAPRNTPRPQFETTTKDVLRKADFRWIDCSLAGALRLLRILIYKVYVDGTTTMSTHERKASIKEFYAVIFPSLLQLQRGITDMEDKKQKAVCMERYRRRDEDETSSLSDIDAEREEECGICMEMNSKVVLPNCMHAMCLRCYQDWNSRLQSCPFCRDNLKKTDTGDLWIYVEDQDVVDMETVSRENLRRLFMYINKLPLIVPDVIFSVYDSHIK